MERKTALYEEHIKRGGKIVTFAGYELPIQYEGVMKEHMAVRQAAGIFDVSHMGEFLVTGEQATEFLNFILTNEIGNMKDGQIKYSPMLYEEGGIIDDLLVYRQSSTEYMLVVNASNRIKDFAWIMEYRWDNVIVEDVSDSYSQLALQGPKAVGILKKLVAEDQIPAKYYTFKDHVMIEGMEVLVSRNGYTGEDGVELYVANEHAVRLYQLLMEKGQEEGLIACGLGARDTLRLEAGMPLYGHEMSEIINPLEAGIGMFVKMEKESFVGKEALLEQPGTRTRVGLKMVERGIAREHCPILADGRVIGEVTSGTQLPYVNEACAFGLIEKEYGAIGSEVVVDIRGRLVKAVVVSLPFYKRTK